MTEQSVRLYFCAYAPTSGASHRLLLRALAQDAPGLTAQTLAFGEHGKPYLPHAPQLCFNLSHSGGYWLCAISDAPVGVDVQQHRPCKRAALARRFYSQTEVNWLQSRDEAAFFDLWSAKESYLKYTGQGLAGLKEAVVVSADGCFPVRPDAKLQCLPLFPGYSVCVCTATAANIQLKNF